MARLFFIFSFTLSVFVVFSQEKECDEKYKMAYKAYERSDFAMALSLFQEMKDCHPDNIMYYNAACFAALVGDRELALHYLRESVMNGYEDVRHMAADTDLNAIRQKEEYYELLNFIERKYDSLLTPFASFKNVNSWSAIPYQQNGKWGWLNIETMKPLTKAVFDYTNFREERGMPFTLNNGHYVYDYFSPGIKIILVFRGDIPEPEDIPFYDWQPDRNPAIKGFRLKNSNVKEMSDKYVNIRLTYPPQYGIVKDSSHNYGVIYQNGDIVKGLGFHYSHIDYYRTPKGGLYFIAKKKGEEYYLIYNERGEVILDKPIREYAKFSREQGYHNENFFDIEAISGDYLKLKIRGKWNVFEVIESKTLFRKGYDSIMMINGPKESGLSYREERPLEQIYFLVQDNNKLFYVRADGKEFKLK